MSVQPDQNDLRGHARANGTVSPLPQSDKYSLLRRVASATVLLPLGLAAIISGEWFLAVAASFVGVAMAYEWARMQRPDKLFPDVIVFATGAALCPLLAGMGLVQWMMPTAILCAVLAASLRRTWIGHLEAFCGVLYMAAPGALFVWIRDRENDGLAIALVVAVTVWATDIAAYFSGRAIGGPKIFPQTSPHKTWAGFVGGIVAGGSAAGALGSFAGGNWHHWVFAGIVISIMGQLGDMFESMVKRHFKVKDASNMIPGHGGVLDRLDGLMAASVLCALVLSIAPELKPELSDATLLRHWR